MVLDVIIWWEIITLTFGYYFGITHYQFLVGDEMEIVGGFMVMMSIIGFFLAVVWLVMPFVVFAIKGKQDRTLDVLESMEKRLKTIEARIYENTEKSAKDEPPVL